MSLTATSAEVEAPPAARRPMSAAEAWGLMMLAPYVLVFLVFVVYPVGYGLWLARHPASYVHLFEDPIFTRAIWNTLAFLLIGINAKMLIALVLSGFFVTERVWIRWLSLLFILPWAVPSIPTILSIRFMLNPEWGIVNSLIFRLTGDDGPNWLNDPTLALAFSMVVHVWKSLPFWTLILIAGRLAIPADLRGVVGRRRQFLAEVPLCDLAVDAEPLSDLHGPLDDLDARRLQQRLSADRRRTGRSDPRARHARHPLSEARSGRHVARGRRLRAAPGAAARVLHDAEAGEMRLSLRAITTEAKLLLIGIPVLIWTMLPIYHLVLFSISPKDSALSGKLWPDHPTLDNFRKVFLQQHHYLDHFWQQMWNSFVISAATGILTLLVATLAAFAISRLKVRFGGLVLNLALFTYFIPAAFLAVPMYRTMGLYGLLNNQWALILAMVTIASPYAIWVLKQASDKLPHELDEAAVMDGATPLQIFRLVYLPLMAPSLVAVGTYALLLAWNEYLYAFLLLSRDTDVTLSVGLGNFLAADDSPWELLMTTGLIYALPPAAIYYVFKRYMVSGLTAGAVKS